MKNTKHIFFDLDNTLWDFEKNSREALLQLFHEYQIDKLCHTSFDEFISVYEKINHELWHLYSLQLTTKEELRYQRFHKAFMYFNFDNVDIAQQWANDYLTLSPYKTHLIEGTHDVLNYLKDKYTLHIITNGFKEVQDIKLNSCKLKHFFDEIIISEDHGFNKPDIKLFKIAQSLTNSTASECVMIGDNYDTDILGALNAKWKAIHLSSAKIENENGNFFQIENLKRLVEIL